MFYLLSAAASLTLLTLFAYTLCRLHHKRELPYMLPAVGLTFLLILAETGLHFFPSHSQWGITAFLVIQVMLCPAWLLFSLSYARKASLRTFSKIDTFLLIFSILLLSLTIILPTSSFYYQTDFISESIIFLEHQSFYLYMFIITMYMIAIGNLESTFRSSKHSDQWRIKFSLFGACVIICSLILYSSQGVLYNSIDILNAPFRNIAICIGLLLILHAEWRRKSGSVVISRKVAFRSLAAAIAGLYLLGLGLTREGARLFGGGFARTLIFVSLGAACCAALAFVLSQGLRRKMTIWIQRNFYDEKYNYRSQWMQFSERLSRATDHASFVHATLVSFCDIFGRTGAFYLPVDHDSPNGIGRGVYYEVDEASARSVPDEACSLLLPLPPRPLLVEESNFSQFPQDLFLALSRMRIGIVLPIRAAEEPEGVLFLGQPINGKEKYDIEDFELMEAMGRQTGLSAKSFRLSEEMAVNREMEALGKLGALVLHDLKNQVYALSLLADNARRFITDPTFQADMLETLANTVANMKILITQLTHLPGAENMRFEKTDLYNLAVKFCGQFPDADICVTGKKPAVTVDAEQIGKVLLNLCLNALEADGNSPVRVEIDEEDVPLFRVHDTAGGIPEEVVQAGLFKPFNSTKQRGMGIGLYHSRKIVEAHGAKITVANRPGVGCTFTVRFEGEKLLRTDDATGRGGCADDQTPADS